MSEKKGLFGGLFGKKSGGCCNMEIVEESETCCCDEADAKPVERKMSGCCDMQIIPEDE